MSLPETVVICIIVCASSLCIYLKYLKKKDDEFDLHAYLKEKSIHTEKTSVPILQQLYFKLLAVKLKRSITSKDIVDDFKKIEGPNHTVKLEFKMCDCQIKEEWDLQTLVENFEIQ